MAKCIVNFCEVWGAGLEAPSVFVVKLSRELKRNRMMEVNAGYSRSNEKQLPECRKSADKGKKPAEKDASASAFEMVDFLVDIWHDDGLYD
ncbi:hypothetical protein GOBAR_DD36461 [Gossypium barbadense]|nr:hypothetical protein GOBAR_DD36461 [Gossypium barbadense]